MGRGLTAAQRRAVEGSEAGTGRVTARAEVCTALVAAGLAVRHGRTGHVGCYLTQEGLRVRGELAAREREREAGDARGTAAEPRAVADGGGRFAADDGTGALAATAGRAAEVAAAWEGLVQIRAVLGDGATQVPAGWERERLVHAVALALEAAGVPPARGDGSAGYRVRLSVHPGLAEITWSEPGSAPAALPRVAALLTPLGWQPTTHHTRDGSPYLLASPRTQ